MGLKPHYVGRAETHHPFLSKLSREIQLARSRAEIFLKNLQRQDCFSLSQVIGEKISSALLLLRTGRVIAVEQDVCVEEREPVHLCSWISSRLNFQPRESPWG